MDILKEGVMSKLNGFLRDVKVLDLSQYLPGPLATLMLADMGAEVIKVEPPNGDEMRSLGPKDEGRRSIFFHAVNAGKRSVRIDLKTTTGCAQLLELAVDADVLVESFRPSVMKKFGLDSTALRRVNPGLIYVSMSGYGRNSPKSNAGGHDANYLSGAGALYANGSNEGSGLIFPPVADCTGSMFALSAILGALISRQRDGEGCDIDLALADVIMPFQILALAELGVSGRSPERGCELMNGGWACYRVYTTRDGREVALGAVELKFWQAFCIASGHSEWISLRENPLPQHALIQSISRHIDQYTLDECLALYKGVDCCFSAVLNLQEAVNSEHVKSRGLVRQDALHKPIEALFPVLVDGIPPQSRLPLDD